MMAVWYKPLKPASRSVSFIIPHHGRHLRCLRRLKSSSTLLLEGPYGQELHLESIENVCLVAKGLGILSVLPMAQHLAMRRSHDNYITQLMQDLPKMQYHLEESEQRFKFRDEQLNLDETELGQKREDWRESVKSSGGVTRRHNRFKREIKVEERSLREERKVLDRTKERILQQKRAIDDKRQELSSLEFHSDATRTINIFWHLDHNSQGDWASTYLQTLKDSDPDHVRFAQYLYST